jgi:DNA polymerase III epsilon subunit-like protein
MTRLIFCDTETTGLYPEAAHEVWDIGLIVREPWTVKHPAGPDTTEMADREYQWFVKPNLSCADPNALRIGRFYERTAGIEWDHPGVVAEQVARLFDGAHIIGAVPDFDIRHLSMFLRANGQCSAHHYHLIDTETLAVGYFAAHAAVLERREPGELPGPERAAELRALITPPWKSDDLSAALGVTVSEEERHTSLGDARQCRDVYDAVMGGRP